ncbi:MAG: DUF5703 domain-containing protein, partial [Candidatus Hydrogenedentales bacterium]
MTASLIAAFAVCVFAGSPSDFDVVWDSPSADSSGSMPLGNGDVGVNVWMEPNGDLLFYVSKTDAWDENGRLLKLGRVRVSLVPNLFVAGARFRQSLNLEEGSVMIEAGAMAKLRVWVDANRPVVRVEAKTLHPTSIRVALETWRTEKRALGKEELDSAYGLMEAPHPVYVTPDVVFDDVDDAVVWRHRNETSIWRESLELQGMGTWAESAADPLLHRTFGGMISGEGLVGKSAKELVSPVPRRMHQVSVYCLTTLGDEHGPARTNTDEAGVSKKHTSWKEQIEAIAEADQALSWRKASAGHRAWWKDFWERSWIHVEGDSRAKTVSQGYALQRYITAGAGRGAYPVKFNGSIFTVDAREGKSQFDADYRRWGGPYWFQNTRLVYWPLMASGDTDMMPPLFRMYAEALPFAEARTQAYFGHEGAFFPETMVFW